MLTDDDLSSLRKDGASDSDILTKYQQYSPGEASDISDLLKEGHKPSDILDKLVEFHKPKAMGPVDSAIDLLKGVAHGAGSELQAVGNTNQVLSGEPSRLTSIGKAIDGVAGDYTPSQFDVTKLSTYGDIPKTLAETSPGLAASVGAGAGIGSVIPGLGTVAGGAVGAGLYGGYKSLGAIANLIAKHNGHDTPTTQDIVQALPGAGVSGAIQGAGMGVGGLLGKVGGDVAIAGMPGVSSVINGGTQTLRAGAANAVAGAADNLTQQVAGGLGTRDGVNIDGHEIANAAANAALAAAGHKAYQSGAEGAREARYSKFDTEHAPGFAQDLADAHGDSTQEKFINAKGNAGLDLQSAMKPLSNDALIARGYTVTTQGANGTQKVSGDKSVNEMPQSVLEARNALKNGTILTKDAITSLKGDLQGHHSGQDIVDAIGRLNEANKLENHSGSLEQALSDNGYLDKGKIGLADIKHSLGSALFASALGHNPLYGAAYLAKPYALKYGARTIDRLRGTDNPIQRFMDRYQGMQRLQAGAPIPPPPPSPAAPPPAQPWGPVAPMPTGGAGTPVMPMPQGPGGLPPNHLALVALAKAKAAQQAAEATPVASDPSPAPETPSEAIPPALRKLAETDPEAFRAIMGGQARTTGPDGRPGKPFNPKVIPPTESAQPGTSEPKITKENDLIHIQHSEGVRTIRAEDAPADLEAYANAIETRNGIKRKAYEAPVEGLNAAEQSHWAKLVQPGGEFRADFAKGGLGDHPAAEVEGIMNKHVDHWLDKTGSKLPRAKIKAHLKAHGWHKGFQVRSHHKKK